MTNGEQIVFSERDKPCPGDLRISWRITLLLIILASSRSKKASIGKLHVLNDAARSERSRLKLIDMMNERRPMLDWRLRVEPALSRAVDFLIGEGFARWEATGGRMYVTLLPKGELVEQAISDQDDFVGLSLENIRFLAKNSTESFISALIGNKRYVP